MEIGILNLKGQHVKLKRHGILAGSVLTAALALAACGTDNNTTPGAGASANSGDCASGSLTAQGSTAQLNAVNQWIKDYNSMCPGATINYQGTGSGAGIQAFINGTSDFSGSDSPLKEGDEQTQANNRCKAGPAIHLPMVIGPISIAYNLNGVKDLQLKPGTIAKIFTGKITKWNDAEIAGENPGVSLPDTPILAVHRADSSGTTDNFTKYLSAAAGPDWTLGHDKVWKATGGQAEKGNDGVGGAVAQKAGAIGYVEWSFAQANNLTTAKVYNGAGEYAALTNESAGKTIASAKVLGTGDDMKLSLDYNTTASGAYPIVLVTYEIVCQKGNPADKLPLLKSFLHYAAGDGQAGLTKFGYAPLPSEVQAKVQTAISDLG